MSIHLRGKKINEIPGLKGSVKIKPIKGLLRGNKYYVRNSAGKDMILILGDASMQYRMKDEIRWIKYFENYDIPTNRFLDFGVYDSGQRYYMMLSWIPGKDVQQLFRNESPQFCSLLGRKSGELLRRIHALPLNLEESYHATLSEEISACIAEYSGNDILLKKYPAMETFIRFLEDNKFNLADSGKQKLLHGDYHSGNIIFSEDNVSVIDWIYGTTGNPIEDFVRNVISAESNKYYASALIDGYYNNKIPEEFWRTLAIYTAIHELHITKYDFAAPRWSVSFVNHQHNLVLQEYRGMKTIVPSYYVKR